MAEMTEEEKKAVEYLDKYTKYETFGERNLEKDIMTVLDILKKLQKENDCLKNHVHYKNCIACGEEFRTKRSDTKYCTHCSKSITNKIYFANLTEEQKRKRREKSKLAMRKLREGGISNGQRKV